MRFMMLVKASKVSEAGVLPEDLGPALTPELWEAEERLRAQAAGRRQA